MIPDERRAYVRARLVALAEEVMMASTPQPTERQLRQHALDRALTDGVTGALLSMLIMSDPNGRCNPEQFSDAVTKVADKFVEYLRGPSEEPAYRVTECIGADCPACRGLLEEARAERKANLGLATTRDLLLELYTRGKVMHRSTNIEDAVLGLMSELEHDEATLSYRPVDA